MYIEQPEITQWHSLLLAYFIHISNVWLIGLEDKCELRAKQRTWCPWAREADESRPGWPSILVRAACLRVLNGPHCSLSWPHSQTHTNTHLQHHMSLPSEAPWNYFMRQNTHIIKKTAVLEAITWYMNTSEGPKMLAVAFSFSVFKELYFALSFYHLLVLL